VMDVMENLEILWELNTPRDDITVQGFSVFLSCSSLKPESCLPYEAKGLAALLVSSREPACLFRMRTMRGRTADPITKQLQW